MVGRGSRDHDATKAMIDFSRARSSFTVVDRVQVGFLAIAQPRFEDVLQATGQMDVRRIIVQPHLLFGGDLVRYVTQSTREIAHQFPQKEWLTAGHLGPHRLLVEAILDQLANLLGALTRSSASMHNHVR